MTGFDTPNIDALLEGRIAVGGRLTELPRLKLEVRRLVDELDLFRRAAHVSAMRPSPKPFGKTREELQREVTVLERKVKQLTLEKQDLKDRLAHYVL